jgi:hypothetical protein
MNRLKRIWFQRGITLLRAAYAGMMDYNADTKSICIPRDEDAVE